MRRAWRALTAVGLLASLASCDDALPSGAAAPVPGEESDWPGELLPPDMSAQPRYDPYEPSDLFPDGMSARRPPEGTVARERELDPLPLAPLDAPEAVLRALRLGQERFMIYCSPCHGRDGYGRGMIVRRGFPRPPSFHTARLREKPDAYLLEVLVHGRGVMPPYGQQVEAPEERRAVVLFIRALQRSQAARLDDVPPPERARLARERAVGGAR